MTTALPHDPYITAVVDALAAAGLDPDSCWTSDAEIDPYATGPDAGCTTMLSAILIWEGDHQAVDADELPDGVTLIWEHPAEQWQWGERGPHGALLNAPEFLPKLGRYSHPEAVVTTVRALLTGTPCPRATPRTGTPPTRSRPPSRRGPTTPTTRPTRPSRPTLTRTRVCVPRSVRARPARSRSSTFGPRSRSSPDPPLPGRTPRPGRSQPGWRNWPTQRS